MFSTRYPCAQASICATANEPKGVSTRSRSRSAYRMGGSTDRTASSITISPTVATNHRHDHGARRRSHPLLPGVLPTRRLRASWFDGEFVTVLIEGVEPITVLAIPRAVVLSDQQGDYVYVVDAQNKAQRRPIQLGQSNAVHPPW